MVSLRIVVSLIIFFESLLLFFPYAIRRLLYIILVFAIHCVAVVHSINKKSIFEIRQMYVKNFKSEYTGA